MRRNAPDAGRERLTLRDNWGQIRLGIFAFVEPAPVLGIAFDVLVIAAFADNGDRR
jgi:hypothetical protein